MSWQLHKGHYIWPGRLPESVSKALGAQQSIKDGKVIGYVCRASIPNYRTIRYIGMEVASPTESPEWDWPGQYEPMRHQRRTVASMLSHQRSFVLDDPGTGKTLSAIWGLDAMRRLGACRRTLIVAPKSIIYGVWRDELFLTTDWRVGNLVGKTRDRRQAMVKDPRNEVLLVNPESLHSIAEVVEDLDSIIVDEFTAFKTYSTKRSAALRGLVAKFSPWLVMMSGTPAPQGPADAYHPIKLVNPKAQRMTKRVWQDMTEIKVSEFTWVPKPDAQKTLTKWLQPGTRTSREEAIDLPTLQTLTRRYEITKQQDKAIRDMKAQAQAETEEGTITAANAAVAASKMLQILTGHVRMTDPHTEEEISYSLPARTWLEAVEEVVDERHDPVLIFVPFRAAATALGKHLACPVVMGDTDQEERQQIYREINAGEVRAVVAVAATMSHGLTLTGSNCVLWALPPASAEQYQQANARVYRKGQVKPVDIIHLVGHDFVQALFARTDKRVKLQQAVLDALAVI